MTTNTVPLWICPCCNAVTTDAGRRMFGELCFLCAGTLYRDDTAESAGTTQPKGEKS